MGVIGALAVLMPLAVPVPVRADSLTLKEVKAPSGASCRVRLIVPFSLANKRQSGNWQVHKIPGTSRFVFKPPNFRDFDPAYVIDMEQDDLPRVASAAETAAAEPVANVWSRRPEASEIRVGKFGRGLRFEETTYVVSGGSPFEFYFSKDGRYAVVESIVEHLWGMGMETGTGRETTTVEFFHAHKPGKSIGKLVIRTNYVLMPRFVPYPRWLDDEYFIVPTRLDHTQALVCKFPKSD